MLQCVAVCYSVLQCVAVCCSVSVLALLLLLLLWVSKTRMYRSEEGWWMVKTKSDASRSRGEWWR